MKITKKLEEFYPNLLPDTYLIHSEGGYHPWQDVQEASSIYRVRIWPYIQRISWPTSKDFAAEWRKNNKPEQMNLSLSFMHIYPYATLERPGGGSHTVQLHRASALAFIPNPEQKTQVCHINDDPTNYLLHNLKWGTNKENHKDRGANSGMTDSTMHAIFKMRGWAKG